ncbi:MAG: recombinase RecT [Hyphomicrobiaceae bacterium]
MSNRQLSVFDAFRSEITRRGEELARILPPHIPIERFETTALIAIKDNPALLGVDRRSLHQAITEAAEDGLHPDGREGVITIYKEKKKRQNENGAWIEEKVEVAQWTPMIFGIRKRAREVCGIIIDADVVHEKDRFVRRGGDAPCLEHEPPMLGQDRGKPVGAYAVFRQGNEVLHREIMDAAQIADVRAQSRNKDGLMWTKFWTEAWKKTVIRRGVKTVPAVPEFDRIVKREDRAFNFGGQDAALPSIDLTPKTETLRAGKAARALVHDADGVIIDEIAEPEPGDATARPQDTPPAADQVIADDPPPKRPDTPLAQYEAACAAAETPDALNAVWAMFERRLPVPEHGRAVEIFEAAFSRLTSGGKR